MLSCKVTNSMPLFGRSFGTCRKNKTYLGARHCKGHAEPWTMAINVYSIAKLRSILFVLILRWQALCGKCSDSYEFLAWNDACMLVDRFKVPWHRMFIASMGSVLFMETGSHDITRGITFHILLERGQNCFIYRLFFLHLLWFRCWCPTLAQVFVGQLSTKREVA